MSLGLSAAAVGLIGIGTGAVGAVLSSKATKEQSKIQAKAIKDGGEIDTAARNEAISQVLEIFGPSLVDFNESMQNSIDLMESGRISTGDLLTQSANNVSGIIQKGGQDAMNAMLGIPSTAQPQQTGQAQTQAPQMQGQQVPQTQQQAQQALPGSIVNDSAFDRSPKGIGAPAGIQPSLQQVQNLATDGGINQPQMSQNGIAPQVSSMPAGYEPMGPFPVGSQGYLDDIAQRDPSVYQPTTPLEGEVMPRDYNFQQQGVTMPQGTGAGLMGAVDAVQAGANLGRQDLATAATGSLESLGTQTGIARDDIGQGRDFALNQIQQAIQAGRGGVNRGVGSIRQGTQQGVNAINQGVSQAVGFLNPYMSAGKEALNPLLALSGVRGQEAFDSALINDPAYNYALRNSETALARNAGVTGGIGSGNVKGRFQQNAQEMGAANIDRQLGRFRSITDAGQRAAGTAGGFTTQGGIAAGGLESRGGIAAGQMQSRGGEIEAAQLNQMASVGIRSSEQLAQLAQQLGMSEAQVLQSLGGNLANIDVSAGQQIGGMNEQAGINAANIIQGTANSQGGIDAGLAQQLAGLDQNTLNNIVNSMQSGAGTNLSSNQQLSTILANLGIGAGSSAQNTTIGIGQAEAAGVTNPIGNAINTATGLYASGAFNQSSQPPVYQQGGYSPNQFQPWTPMNQGGQ